MDFRRACFSSFTTHTHGAKVRLFTPLCDVSRAAGGRTDGDWHHSSHQDMEPISPTHREVAGCSASCTHTILLI